MGNRVPVGGYAAGCDGLTSEIDMVPERGLVERRSVPGIGVRLVDACVVRREQLADFLEVPLVRRHVQELLLLGVHRGSAFCVTQRPSDHLTYCLPKVKVRGLRLQLCAARGICVDLKNSFSISKPFSLSCFGRRVAARSAQLGAVPWAMHSR